MSNDTDTTEPRQATHVFDRPLTPSLHGKLTRGEVAPENLLGGGPAHADRSTEIEILRWAHGYRDGDPDPWTAAREREAAGS